MSGRPKKESKALNIKLDAKLYEKLENCRKSTKRTKTAIIEIALELYLDNLNSNYQKDYH